jgi:hypothetical protein
MRTIISQEVLREEELAELVAGVRDELEETRAQEEAEEEAAEIEVGGVVGVWGWVGVWGGVWGVWSVVGCMECGVWSVECGDEVREQ